MPHWDPSRYNALLATHARAGDRTAALDLLRRMHRGGARLDGYTFTPVLAVAPDLARPLHALMHRTGIHSVPVPATALLAAYSKSGRPTDALSLFDEMPRRDSVAWNTLLSCLSRHGFHRRAVASFRSMARDGVALTGFTLCSVLKSCALSRALRQGRQVHAQATLIADNSLVMGTELIHLYSSCGAIEDAVAVFRRLDCAVDAAACNALVSGCVRSGRYDEAFSLIRDMEPNAVALTSGLSACFKSSKLPYGKQIHCMIIRRGFDSDTISCNSLLDMYAKCGDVKAANSVFGRIREKDVVSWTSIIDAYGSHGHGMEAVAMFKKMEEEEFGGVPPNHATFLSVLSACGHSGLVDEGRNCFFSMRNKHGLDPRPEHYACFIDMLGRAHMIEEAWDFFSDVSASAGKMDSAVCVAMLNACVVSTDSVKGDYVVKYLRELEPDNPSVYVLISNFYAATGRWEGLEDSRKMMRARGLIKEAGNSQIAVNSCY